MASPHVQFAYTDMSDQPHLSYPCRETHQIFCKTYRPVFRHCSFNSQCEIRTEKVNSNRDLSRNSNPSSPWTPLSSLSQQGSAHIPSATDRPSRMPDGSDAATTSTSHFSGTTGPELPAHGLTQGLFSLNDHGARRMPHLRPSPSRRRSSSLPMHLSDAEQRK